jgi:hypothetical protein
MMKPPAAAIVRSSVPSCLGSLTAAGVACNGYARKMWLHMSLCRMMPYGPLRQPLVGGGKWRRRPPQPRSARLAPHGSVSSSDTTCRPREAKHDGQYCSMAAWLTAAQAALLLHSCSVARCCSLLPYPWIQRRRSCPSRTRKWSPLLPRRPGAARVAHSTWVSIWALLRDARVEVPPCADAQSWLCTLGPANRYCGGPGRDGVQHLPGQPSPDTRLPPPSLGRHMPSHCG